MWNLCLRTGLLGRRDDEDAGVVEGASHVLDECRTRQEVASVEASRDVAKLVGLLLVLGAHVQRIVQHLDADLGRLETGQVERHLTNVITKHLNELKIISINFKGLNRL